MSTMQNQPSQKESSGLFSRLGQGAVGLAKEAYKGTVRPFTTPFAGFYSGVQGLRGKDTEVELPGWLGGAKASSDPSKQARITGGAALEAASIVPAGKALVGLRALKTSVPLKSLDIKEAKLGARTGLTGGAGYELGQNEEATAGDVVGSALIGGTIGAAIGGSLPIAGRGVQTLRSWSKQADEVVEQALQAETKQTKRAGVTWDKQPPPDPPGGVELKKPLSEIDDDLFPVRSEQAMDVPAPLKKKAESVGYKPWQVNLISEMSPEEKNVARAMMEMAENKSQNILAKSPVEKAAEPVVNQYKHLMTVRKQSGEALDGLVDGMPKEAIPLGSVTDDFTGWLTSKNIAVKTVDGKPFLMFNKSNLSTDASAKDRKVIQGVFNELYPPHAKGRAVHRTPAEIRTIRQRLFKINEANKKASDPFSKETEGLINSVRQQLNEPLSALSPEYAAANKNYAIASNNLTTFKKFLGKDFFDAEDDEVVKRIGELLPRLVSNTSAKPGVILKQLADAATETGMAKQAIDDPRRLIYTAEMLNDLYGINAPRGFQGSIERGIENKIGVAADIAGGMADLATMRPLSVAQRAMKYMGADPILKRQQLFKEMIGNAPPPKGNAAASAKTALGKDAQQSMMGGVAGIEPEFDEQGRPTGKIGFSPEKAAMGMAGMTAAKKVLPKLKGQVDDIAQAKAKGMSFDEWVKGQGEVMYHGTSKKFDVFDESKVGSGKGSTSVGTWFTSNMKEAEAIGEGQASLTRILQKKTEKPRVVETYAKFDNPKTVDVKGEVLLPDKADEIVRQAKAVGHDAVIFKDVNVAEGVAADHAVAIDLNKLKTRSALKAKWDAIK
jgi:hypothetical protein